MESTKPKDEAQKPSPTVSGATSDSTTGSEAHRASKTPDSYKGEESNSDVGSTSGEPGFVALNVDPSKDSTLKPAAVNPVGDAPEIQGTKRPKSPATAMGSETTTQDPKSKKFRKETDHGSGNGNSSVSASATHDKTMDSESDVTETGALPKNNSVSQKVPPIKIALQPHNTGETDKTTATSSQAHTMPTSGSVFPYIVTTVSADSSGTSVSVPASAKDKARGAADETASKSKDEVALSSTKDKNSSNSEDQKLSPQPPTLQPEATELEKSEATTSSGTAVNVFGLSNDDKTGKEPTPALVSVNLAIDGSQSPSSGGKDKTTRVTRSSQRIATTIHSSSPGTSPKNSTCSSPNQMELEAPPPTLATTQAQQVSTPKIKNVYFV